MNKSSNDRKRSHRKASGRKSWKRGHVAESCAALWLSLKGYRILERRWSCPVGEIDIIAQRGHTMICVEVKYRSGDSSTAISVHQQRRLCHAAHIYFETRAGTHTYPFKIARHFKRHTANNSSKLNLRMDAFLIDGLTKFRHIEDAWRCNL